MVMLEAHEAWQLVLALRRALERGGFARRTLTAVLPQARSEGLSVAAQGTRAVEPKPQPSGPGIVVTPAGEWRCSRRVSPEAAAILDLYVPLCLAGAARVRAGASFAVGHLAQSLDGRIATVSGASQWITGPEDRAHTHRMRALSQAVIVGAGTVRHDDPQLTVRLCDGKHPIRVVIDTERRLPPDHGVFQDGLAPTLLLCAQELADDRPAGKAEVVGIARARGTAGQNGENGLSPGGVLADLRGRGIDRVFVEGGGVTISRFLAAGCLDRLQITISPLIIGSGRPGIALPEVRALTHGLRPRVRRFDLGEDLMFECDLGG